MAGLLADAFADDRRFVALCGAGGRARRRFLREWFEVVVETAERFGCVDASADGDGVVVWDPGLTGRFTRDLDEALTGLVVRRLGPAGLDRLADLSFSYADDEPTATAAAEAPAEILYLAVARRHRRRGIAAHLVRRIFAECAHTGRSVGLDCADPSVVPFYLALGFHVVQQRATAGGIDVARLVAHPAGTTRLAEFARSG